eukprot:gene2882-5653_t
MLSGILSNISVNNSKRFQYSIARALSTIAQELNITQPSLTKVYHPYHLTEVPPNSGNDKNLFAVIEFSGTQYKVTKDDLVVANKITDVDIGDNIELSKVLLVGCRDFTHIGRPLVSGAKVMATVEEMVKDDKVIIFKKRRRKNSQRTRGFRRQLTILRITDIIFN